ncbi:hypothetical protein BGZ65_007221 [Modicella reniformis]|uniref:Uncharacterized protein n=1 Tax=Modicella reniformis TaxID=1440133 RepID=A0A9P6JMN5_9FUNG|nr:hypothetical protein BGZ65_007221 [Modicella reniformis]
MLEDQDPRGGVETGPAGSQNNKVLRWNKALTCLEEILESGKALKDVPNMLKPVTGMEPVQDGANLYSSNIEGPSILSLQQVADMEERLNDDQRNAYLQIKELMKRTDRKYSL